MGIFPHARQALSPSLACGPLQPIHRQRSGAIAARAPPPAKLECLQLKLVPLDTTQPHLLDVISASLGEHGSAPPFGEASEMVVQLVQGARPAPDTRIDAFRRGLPRMTALAAAAQAGFVSCEPRGKDLAASPLDESSESSRDPILASDVSRDVRTRRAPSTGSDAIGHGAPLVTLATAITELGLRIDVLGGDDVAAAPRHDRYEPCHVERPAPGRDSSDRALATPLAALDALARDPEQVVLGASKPEFRPAIHVSVR
jgi:hypothetical protein